MGQIGIAQAQLSAASGASASSTEITDGTYRVSGLNAVTVGTSSLSMQADVVELWRSSDRTLRYVAGSSAIVNDIATTGLNGRDQSTSFGANNWIHFYYVGPNSVTSSSLATRSSLVAPPTGPTLPSSETHWAYAGPVRCNASTFLLPTRFRGALAFHNTALGGEIRVLSAGTSTSFTAVNASAYIPPNSQAGIFSLAVASTNSPRYVLLVRPTGSTEVGQDLVSVTAVSVSTDITIGISNPPYPVSSSQHLDYMVSPTGSIGAFIDVLGYTIPNGDA